MEKLQGSMEMLSAMQITADTAGLDIPSKTILHYAEILAVILKNTVSEYKGYGLKEITEFIITDSITSTMEVSPGRTNTKLRGDNPEFIHLNEKTTLFDLAFRAKNPLLSTENLQIYLHIDVEPQKTYKPGYPIEKRGIYYLARRLSSQLSLALAGTDYSQLSKCYSIFICRDDIPLEDRYSISIYQITNTKNTASNPVAKENYDLLTLVVIKLGNEVYNGDKEDDGYHLFRFLNAIFYPHKDNFMATVTEYIDYSGNPQLWKEVTQVSSLEQVIFEGARDDGFKMGWAEAAEKARKMEEELGKKIESVRKTEEELGKKIESVRKTEEELGKKIESVRKTEEKGIEAMILDNLEEQIPKARIILKLQKHFNITEEKSKQYYQKYAAEVSYD